MLKIGITINCWLVLNTEQSEYFWLPSGGLRLKSSSLHVFLHGNNSAVDCARELFKPSKDSASLHIWNEKKIVSGFFESDVTSGFVLDLFGPLHLPNPKQLQRLDVSILLKFVWKTGLKG